MHDFAIVGSGVSGGRIAEELCASGARCVLLEAGKAYDRRTFPPGEMASSTRLFWGGGIELSRDARFGFLRGKCLGGTSVVNQADLDRFDAFALDAWRGLSGVEFFRGDSMDPLYDELDRRIAMGPIPEQHWNRNARLFIDAFEKKGLGWRPILRSQTECRLDRGSDCIVCLGGCPRDAKQSTLVTSIPAAVKNGLEVRTECEIHALEHRAHSVVLRGRARGEEREWIARRVVLAAGAFGNVGILRRSREIAERLPALGSSFCCHPQYMTYGVHDEPVDAHKGALQSVQAHDPSLRVRGLKFENVFAGPIATAMLLPGVGRTHLENMSKFRRLACIEVAIMDDPAGEIEVARNGRIVPKKPLTDLDRKKIREGLLLAEELLREAGAREVLRCEQGFGLHLMGGCPIGVDPRRSVVGPDFRIHGHENLYCADSSIFPTAPGINPSFTIMALSLKASREMLREAA